MSLVADKADGACCWQQTAALIFTHDLFTSTVPCSSPKPPTPHPRIQDRNVNNIRTVKYSTACVEISAVARNTHWQLCVPSTSLTVCNSVCCSWFMDLIRLATFPLPFTTGTICLLRNIGLFCCLRVMLYHVHQFDFCFMFESSNKIKTLQYKL